MPTLQEIRVPLVAVNDTSLTVADIIFEQGTYVKKDEIVLVLETSKTTYDVLAETDGFINYYCETGGDYEVNDTIAKIFSEASEVIRVEKNTKHTLITADIQNDQYHNWEGETLFSPAAIALIESSGINHAVFAGQDFVSREDVELLIGKEKKRQNKSGMDIRPFQKTLITTDPDKVIVEKISSNKKREIEYLSAVQSGGLTSTVNTFIDTAGIFVHINQSLQYLKNSLLPVIIYEAARLLEKYTTLNAYFTGDGTAFYRRVDIGFAIDIEKGLKVLKIGNTVSKSMSEIEEEIMALSGKYIDEKLEIIDLTGISFTITDLSAEGVAFFKPLINSMNSAILGISSNDEKLDRCILSLTFDHRVTEGKLAARFLQELKARLESYRSTLQSREYLNINCFKCFKTLEEDLSDTGFSRCITPDGRDAYICQACFKGY